MGQALLLKYPKQGWKILISWSEHRPYLSSIIHPIKKKKKFQSFKRRLRIPSRTCISIRRQKKKRVKLTVVVTHKQLLNMVFKVLQPNKKPL